MYLIVMQLFKSVEQSIKLWYDITCRGGGTHHKKRTARGDTHNKKHIKR
jgi:hypothetical protein